MDTDETFETPEQIEAKRRMVIFWDVVGIVLFVLGVSALILMFG